jgi:hypothetical protein
MTSAGTVHSNNGTTGRVELFYLKNPALGANTVAVTNSGTSADLEAGSVSFTGVDQTTPVRNITTNAGLDTSPSLTVSSAPGNMVVDGLVDGDGTTNSSQTLRWKSNQNTLTGGGNGAQSTAAGAASVNMGYTITNSDWGIIGMDVVAVQPGIQVSSRSDTLSDSRPSATSNHTVTFTVNNAIYGSSISGSSTLRLAFPGGFSVPGTLDCGDVDAATSSQFNFNYPSCYQTSTAWGFSATGAVITLVPPSDTAVHVATGTPITIKIGSNATFQQQGTHWITNPSSAGVYTISVGGTFGGSGNMLVSINAGVTVQATVAESLAFTVAPPAFPTTGILDNFNRANEDPLGNGNWTCPLRSGDNNLRVLSNLVALPSAGIQTGNCYWSAADFGPDTEVFLTISTKPANSECLALVARISGAGSSISGYWGEFCSSAGTDTWDLYRVDSGVFTHLGTQGTAELTNGDKVGLEVIGNNIKLYYKPAAGSWTLKTSASDSTYPAAGKIGINIEQVTARGDDFGGGTVNGCPANDGATVNQIATTATSVPFGTINSNTFYQGCQDLIVSTNAGGGYSVTVQESSAMKTADGRFIIPDTTCDAGDCTVATATTWVTPTKNGFGHTCFNQSGSDCNASYANGTKFKPLSNTAAGNNGATINFVQSASSSTSSATGSMSVSFGSNNSAGNLIVVAASVYNGGRTINSISDTAGNIYQTALGPVTVAGGNGNAYIFYAKNIKTGSNMVTVNFSDSAAGGEIFVHEYAGADTNTPLDVTASNSGNSASLDSSSASTNFANELIFGYGNSVPGITSPGAGFTLRVFALGDLTEEKIVASKGSYKTTATANSGNWAMLMATFKAFPDVGQTVMSNTGTVTNSTGRAKYRLSVGSAQAAGTYTTLITYTILGTF